MAKKEEKELINLTELIDKNGNEADLVLLGEIERIDEAIEKVEETLEEKIEKKVGKDGHTPTEKELLSLIRPLVPPRVTEKELKALIKPLIPKPTKGKDGKDGKDGISPNPQEIIQEVIKQIPPPIVPVPLTGDETIEIINSDDTEKKIKKERIEGLDEIERLARQKGGTMIGGISSGGGRVVKTHDLSASLDGSTKTFSLPAFWRVLLVLSASFPYGAARETVDWTSDANASRITFTAEIDAATTLASGGSLLILYAEA